MNIDNEFAWRNQLRGLRGDVEPARELWPSIAARIAVRPATQRWRSGLGLAAALVVAAGVGALAWRTSSPPAVPLAAATVPTPVAPEGVALAWAIPKGSQLAVGARDLDAASAALQQAIERQPRALFLVGLLNRTNDQRLRLLRQAQAAG